VILLD